MFMLKYDIFQNKRIIMGRQLSFITLLLANGMRESHPVVEVVHSDESK